MVTIRSMTSADMPIAMRLTDQAGWNQRPADWRRFWEMEPAGCFVAEWNHRSAGITVTCVFESVAWIAMVLVDEHFRRQGIATRLIRHALAFLEARGVETVRLDATDAGKRIYDSLGFVTEFEVTRYGGTARAGHRHRQVVAAVPGILPELIALDADVAGCDRGTLLRRLFTESPHPARVVYGEGVLAGFVMARPGGHALQIGPCIAAPSAGPWLIEDMLHCCAGERVCLDIPSDHKPAVAVVETLGLTPRRRFTRMFRGRRPTGDRRALWSSSGPEKG
jgi:ribosomal protein S18 acetylase RimI-like enzyme